LPHVYWTSNALDNISGVGVSLGSDPTGVVAMNVPAGSYAITVSADVDDTGKYGETIACLLQSSEQSPVYATFQDLPADGQVNIPLDAAATLHSPGWLMVSCLVDGAGPTDTAVAGASLMAVPVSGIN
jgi:hypothetical protein